MESAVRQTRRLEVTNVPRRFVVQPPRLHAVDRSLTAPRTPVGGFTKTTKSFTKTKDIKVSCEHNDSHLLLAQPLLELKAEVDVVDARHVARPRRYDVLRMEGEREDVDETRFVTVFSRTFAHETAPHASRADLFSRTRSHEAHGSPSCGLTMTGLYMKPPYLLPQVLAGAALGDRRLTQSLANELAALSRLRHPTVWSWPRASCIHGACGHNFDRFQAACLFSRIPVRVLRGSWGLSPPQHTPTTRRSFVSLASPAGARTRENHCAMFMHGSTARTGEPPHPPYPCVKC
jgi:hypothetical protein